MRKILLLSLEEDISTSNVIRWIHYLDSRVEVIRIHPSDFYNCTIVANDIRNPFVFIIRNREISTDTIHAVWTRKWGSIPFPSISRMRSIRERENGFIVRANLQEESDSLFEFLLYKLEIDKAVYWLNKPSRIYPNKLLQLLVAEEMGFIIPFTFLSTSLYKDNIKKDIVTKPLSHCINLTEGKKIYGTYTGKVDQQSLEKEFLCSLFQEEIKKELELRVFYLAGQCHTIALFSQQNEKTKIDYRHYDYHNPTREEYGLLPDHIAVKIKNFMTRLHLQTGSLDFILDRNGNYVFLEVNPCGQYDIFNRCNIFPDKLIAEHLIAHCYGNNEI